MPADRWNAALEAAAMVCEKWADKYRLSTTHRTDDLVAAAMMCSQAILALREADPAPASSGLVSVPREELEWIAKQYDDDRYADELADRLYDVSCAARNMLAAAEEERNAT